MAEVDEESGGLVSPREERAACAASGTVPASSVALENERTVSTADSFMSTTGTRLAVDSVELTSSTALAAQTTMSVLGGRSLAAPLVLEVVGCGAMVMAAAADAVVAVVAGGGWCRRG